MKIGKRIACLLAALMLSVQIPPTTSAAEPHITKLDGTFIQPWLYAT